MIKLRLQYGVVILAHTISLFVLAYLFFTKDLYAYHSPDEGLSVDFTLRFAAFWFISFLVTLLLYLIYLGTSSAWLPAHEKQRALSMGKLLFSLGMSAALIVLFTFFMLLRAV
ncbi:hypothetical protein [Pontibacter ruber]|uniref:Uncharacterized protein n=1 Tax=Pontibacter ruber TaxID=1343895 RepID=A0ABW5CZE9_9BACT|nr:hypothetical protein [Pontibacter ruber]